jgi:hypothetical protein
MNRSARTLSWCLPAALFAALAVVGGCGGGDRGDAAEASRKDLKERLEALRSVPYTTMTEEDVQPEEMGVVVYDRERAYPGYNLHCSVMFGEARLTDMEGNLIHTWSYPARQNYTWDHAELLEGGDLIVIRKFYDIIKLNWDSELIWRNELSGHHEITICPDSTIYVVAREVHVHRGIKVRFPAIVHLAEDGTELDRWSTYDHLEEIKQKFDQRSFIDTILDSLIGDQVDLETWKPLTEYAESVKAEIDIWPRRYDQFHMNTINILPDTPVGRRDPRFKEGNLLICFRNVNQIAVLDKDTKEILWVWGEGHLDWPHYPVMLKSGNILIFDNGTRKRKYTRLVELNPLTEEVVWEYMGDPPESFYTPEKGSCQPLPNGNILICEGDMGRCFEITREGETVWEWFNPQLAGRKREQVYRMIRYESEMVEPLLQRER